MREINQTTHISEDDNQRSGFIRELIQGLDWNSQPEVEYYEKCIPRTIVQYWHNVDDIPADVQTCLDTWELLEQHGIKRILFDDHKARDFILETLGRYYVAAFDRCRHPAMRCDYFRLCYMLFSGGFYIDADESYQGTDCEDLFNDNKLKLQPLCYDLDNNEMIPVNRFLRDKEYSQNWVFYFNNNPIISPPSHPVIYLALERATRVILSGNEHLDIQSTTGPGNLTASLVLHTLGVMKHGASHDFKILTNWESISISPWPMSYRNDERNWRLWDPKSGKTF